MTNNSVVFSKREIFSCNQFNTIFRCNMNSRNNHLYCIKKYERLLVHLVFLYCLLLIYNTMNKKRREREKKNRNVNTHTHSSAEKRRRRRRKKMKSKI